MRSDMDLKEAERRITERIGDLASRDVCVEVAVVPAGWLTVHVWSVPRSPFRHETIALHAAGQIDLSEPDDGCTPRWTAQAHRAGLIRQGGRDAEGLAGTARKVGGD